jgi:large subunit ribosomal protein L1
MDKNKLIASIKELKEKSKKRNFSQTFDLIINFKGIDLKKEQNRLNSFVILPFSKGKPLKICALIDKISNKEAKNLFDKVLLKEDLNKLDKKEAKKLVQEYDYFIAHGSLMSAIATTLGKVLASKGKMPNPKYGCIYSTPEQLPSLKEKLNKLVKTIMKKETTIKASVGTESMKEEEIAENILTIYNHVISEIPQGKTKLKSVLLKLTMGEPKKLE